MIYTSMKTLLFVIILFVASACSSQTTKHKASGKPEGPSAQVIFREGFEGSLSEIFANWDDIKNGKGMSLSDDVPENSTGKQSLMMTYTPGKDDGGHLYKALPGGYDSLHARFYIKFLSPHSNVHHLVQLGGNYPPTKMPMGGAGTKPKGDDTFITCVEPLGDKWEWGFYTYWMNMRHGPTGNYYGNYFPSAPPKKVEQEKWTCVEFMIKLNSPVNESNGEQALWINGEKIIHVGKGFPNGYWVWGNFHNNPDSLGFEGFQWRNSEQLKINLFWLSYYMTGGKDGEINKMLFDDVVISTGYIGPN